MYEIEAPEISNEFVRCWQAAGRHIAVQAQGPISWLKAALTPPYLEHLSFRLGNQLFFVRIEDVDNELDVPASRKGLLHIADGCKGHPCLMPMQRRAEGWMPEAAGWGLIDARTGAPVDPVALVSDERIEMTDWEVHDAAVQVVRDHLAGAGKKLMSWTGATRIDPAIWFVGDSGPEWVVVRAVRYPALIASPPADWARIAECCASFGRTGHFASVSLASAEDAFDPDQIIPPEPLWRGHAMLVRFDGLSRWHLEPRKLAMPRNESRVGALPQRPRWRNQSRGHCAAIDDAESDPMRAGLLNKTILIERSSTVIDDAGTPVPTWSTVVILRARVVDDSFAEFVRREGGATGNRTVVFMTWYVNNIRPDDRISYDGTTYDIDEISELKRRQGLLIRAVARAT
jgi:SPP1 family predicted phage head-tail adaptor